MLEQCCCSQGKQLINPSYPGFVYGLNCLPNRCTETLCPFAYEYDHIWSLCRCNQVKWGDRGGGQPGMTALLVRKSWEGHKQRLCDWGGGGRGRFARQAMPWTNGYHKKPGSGEEGFDLRSQQQQGLYFDSLPFRTTRERAIMFVTSSIVTAALTSECGSLHVEMPLPLGYVMN